jgi:hypothetical protein
MKRIRLHVWEQMLLVHIAPPTESSHVNDLHR